MTGEWEWTLPRLRRHWGTAYELSKEDGWYVAVRRDNGASVRRRTAGELHDEIVADYLAKPVLRD